MIGAPSRYTYLDGRSSDWKSSSVNISRCPCHPTGRRLMARFREFSTDLHLNRKLKELKPLSGTPRIKKINATASKQKRVQALLSRDSFHD